MSSIKSRTAPTIPRDPEPAELLQYLPLYRVVVCTSCEYAVQPNAIGRHLKDIHQIYRSRRRPFMQYVSSLGLDQPEVVIGSKIHEFPVPGLPVQDGVRCESQGCSFLCGSEKRMKCHWSSAHGRAAQEHIHWRPVPLQTFFRGNLLRYFTATASTVSPTYGCHLKRENGWDSNTAEVIHRNSRKMTYVNSFSAARYL